MYVGWIQHEVGRQLEASYKTSTCFDKLSTSAQSGGATKVVERCCVGVGMVNAGS